MSQHDYVIDDQNGLNFLADLNANLAAIVSQNSGATEPVETYPYMFWADTTAGILKQRNSSDDGWVSLLTLATGLPTDPELAAIAGLTSAADKIPMFSGSGTATLIDFKDEDNFASNSATAVPSQQSVKAYVDTNAALPSQTGNANKVLRTNGTSPFWDSQITIGTAVTTTSGTAIDFTGIPSGVKRITIMFNGVSTSGTSLMQIQIGSGSVTTSGYASAAGYGVGAGQFVSSTTGFALEPSGSAAAATLRNGTYVINTLGSNTWTGLGGIYATTALTNVASSGCSPALSGAIDRVRITTVGGADTFDAGTINISWEF